MGVLNVTPDSFYDGGSYLTPQRAAQRALEMLDEGADWIDIGGESTRPGATAVDPLEEIARVVPVISAILSQRPSAILSVDTSKFDVAKRAIETGARVINDISGLSDERMAPLAARHGITLVIMHMRGVPATMQRDTQYTDLVSEITSFLAKQSEEAIAAGVPADHVIIDPGIGFGKAPLDNPSLIAAIPTFRQLGYRLLIGASRKSFIGHITGREHPSERLYGSIGAAIAAASLGADVLRVHDVGPTRDALMVYAACRGGGYAR